MLKLNLGCYQKKMYGFMNVDIRPEVEPDVVDDIFKLETIKDETVDLIYASHVLEHADRNNYREVLYHWKRVLKPNGVLRVAVPDMQAVCEHYIYHKDLKLLYSFFWGSQKHDYDFHHIGWDEATLKLDLFQAGFKDVYRFDHKKTEHWFVDDYSQCYLPHLDKQNGRLMSLNMEAVK